MTFDMSMTFGNLLTIITLVFGILGIAVRIGQALQRAIAVENQLAELRVAFERRHNELHQDIADVATDVKKIPAMIQALADGKERMDRIEVRLQELEKERRRNLG